MIIFNNFNINPHKKSITDKLEKIKAGDEELRNAVIEEYKPFIIKIVSNATHKYIEIENSEEYSIGLIAFNEAIDCYNTNRGSSFFDFAEQVIRRRIINHFKKIKNESNMYLNMAYDEAEEKDEKNIIKRELFFKNNESDLKEEIMDLKKQLSGFGIAFKDLAFEAPVHKDAIGNSVKIATILAENDEMFQKLNRKKTIPMTDLSKRIHLNTRTVERNRKFIIAVCLILRSDLDLLKEFIKNAEGGNAI